MVLVSMTSRTVLRVLENHFGASSRLLLLVLLLLVGSACERRPAASMGTPQAGLVVTKTAPPASATPASRSVALDGTPATPARPTASTPTARAYPTTTPLPETYTVQTGDTLTAIASRFNCTVEELLRINGLSSPDVIYVGQTLELPRRTVREEAPPLQLMPDSEVVFGPTYKDFSIVAEIQERGGYLATYTEHVEGRVRSGAQIIEMVAHRFSVGPRVLLTLLEFHSAWLTEREPAELLYPFGLRDAGRSGLFLQASWAANRLNQGYYGQLTGRDPAMRFENGTMLRYAPATNPGSAAIANVLARNANPERWELLVSPGGFVETYRELYGDPWQRDVPVIPANLQQPEMALPWAKGETWHFTGGPHGGWGDFSAWAALDFIPPDVHSCWQSERLARAVSPGLVIRSETGEVVVDMDGDGFVGTGWTVFYMHMHSEGRVAVDTQVQTGDPIGYPSCEGGYSEASHLHIARRYNGQWMEAGGPVPFVLDGWQTRGASEAYDGWLVRGDIEKRACECWEDINSLTAR